MKRNVVIGRVWSEIEKLRKRLGLPERTEIAMMDAAFGYKVRNARYRQESEISDVVASRDLKQMCDIGLLLPVGAKRGRYYIADKPLINITERCADRTRAADPYNLIRNRQSGLQLSLPV